MNDIKELAKWLEEEVEFLKNNPDYVGGWYDLGSGLAAVVLWEEGWGDEVRDDCIQSADNPDWALCAGIMLINRDDTPDGWFMPWDSETGDILCETTGITPTEDYEFLAKYLLEDFDRVKDCEIKSNGETICKKESEEDDDSWDEKANRNDGEKPWDDSKHFEDESEEPVEEESLKEDKLDEMAKLPYHVLAWKLFEVAASMNDEEAYYNNFAYVWPDGETRDQCKKDFNDAESYNELKDCFERMYKAYHKDGLYTNRQDILDYAHKIDAKLGLEPIKNFGNIPNSSNSVGDDPYDESLKEDKKVIKEDKEFHSSPYHDVIAEYFDYDSDFEFLDIIANILGRVDDFEDDDDIYQAIDDELIYTYDQWKVLEHYCTPQDANWDVAFESLMGDVFGVCSKIAGMNHSEDNEMLNDVEDED